MYLMASKNLLTKLLKKYGEREVSDVGDHADEFCVFRTQIELKPLDEDLSVLIKGIKNG